MVGTLDGWWSRAWEAAKPSNVPGKRYAAFISYRHRQSSEFAENLELAIKAYAKPIWQPPMAIFRDEKYMVPGAALDELIREALANSRTLIYLASPDAAQSDWVSDELRLWCTEFGRKNDLIIVLTEGTIAFDPVTKELDWQRTDCLPLVLQCTLKKVPLYVDACEFRRPETQTLKNAEFRRAVNQIAAKLRGIDPIEMSGREVRQHRKSIWLRNTLFVAVAASALGFAAAAVVAEINRRDARQQTREAQQRESELLASASRLASARGDHKRALQQALDGLPADLTDPERPLVAEAAGALVEAVNANLLAHSVGNEEGWSRAIAIDPSARFVLYGADSGDVVLWQREPEPGEIFRKRLSGWIVSASFSLEGRRALAASLEGDVLIFDPEGSKPQQPLRTGLRINAAAFNHDARLFALGTRDGNLQIRDTATGEVLATPSGHEDSIEFLRFTSDGSTLISAGHDNRVRRWEVESGAEIGTEIGHESWIVAADLDPTGTVLATASAEHGAALWSLPDGAPLAVLGETGFVGDIRFSQDGGVVVTAAREDRTATVWSVPEGRLLATLPHAREVVTAALLPDGEHVVTGDNDGAIRLWRTINGAEVAVMGRHEVLELVSRMEVGPNGEFVLSSSSGGEVRLWRVRPERGRTFWHRDQVSNIAFNPDGTLLLSSAQDLTCRLWDLDSGGLVAKIEGAETAQSWCEWHLGGKSILFFPFDGDTVQFRDPKKGQLLGKLTGHGAPVGWAAVTENSDLAATATLENEIFLWPGGRDGQSVSLGTLAAWPSDLHLDLLNGRLIASSHDGTIATWQLDPPHIRRDVEWPAEALGRTALSPDGKRLLILAEEGAVHLLDAATMERLDGFDAGDGVVDVVAFSRDATTIALTGGDGVLWLWRLGDRPEALIGHADWISAVAFDPDGTRLATASADGTVRLWRVADGNPVAILRGHSGRITSVDFAPDGRAVASSAEDGSIRVWAVEHSLDDLRTIAQKQVQR